MVETEAWEDLDILSRMPHRRKRALATLLVLIGLLVLLLVAGWRLGEKGVVTNIDAKNLAPSLSHPFGTDWMGRDMMARTVQGLITSLMVGLLSSLASVVLAMLLGMVAAVFSGKVDSAIGWLVDLFLSVPHLLLIILVAFTLGGGVKGVVVAVALTHWPSLTRVVRAEVMQLMTSDFVQVSRKLGKGPFWVAAMHMVPHIIPQILVGFVLLFPHAILHEASITFLGFGLTPHRPAIGIILSEAMKYLSVGKWWLMFFPGFSLLLMVLVFNRLGENLRFLVDPYRAHE